MSLKLHSQILQTLSLNVIMSYLENWTKNLKTSSSVAYDGKLEI